MINDNCINMCLVGCVSAGKSTILNAFFGKDLTQCKIKRTTMMPNKFIETDDISKINNTDHINQTICDMNNLIYTEIHNNKKLNLEDHGNELVFHVNNMDMNDVNNHKICIYDIPGLNDAKTKNTYYEYLKNNFYKFNIILFVVDIYSGLNTSDEMDILNFLVSNIASYNEKYNKNINLLTIVNKADDMQLSCDKLELLGELSEMFDQVYNTIKDKFREYHQESCILGCIPICGLDAHLYRSIKKNRNIDKLSDENILRIGTNEEGSKFRKLTKIEQKNKVKNKIMDDSFVNDMINLSGFSQIEKCLTSFIGFRGSDIIIENILWEYKNLDLMDNLNIIDNLEMRFLILTNLKKYDKELFNLESKKLMTCFNFIVLNCVNKKNDPWEIKMFWDREIKQKINSKNKLKQLMDEFINLDIYPDYIKDIIFNVIGLIFNNESIDVNTIINCFTLLKNIDCYKFENIDKLIYILMKDNKYNKINFLHLTESQRNLVEVFETIKSSNNFLKFLRFTIFNIYHCAISETLMVKLMLFTKAQEIPIKLFIEHFVKEKNLIDTKKNLLVYTDGLTIQKNNIELELYYLHKCVELNDDNNFIDLKLTEKYLMKINESYD